MRVVLGVALIAVIAGCGNGSEALPRGCTAAPLAIERALRRAPAPVTLQGAPISRCFTHNASAENVQIVGTYLLAAAQGLEARAQQGDDAAALQLGYLLGAADRGARRNGVSSELVRRLQAETAVAAGQRQAYNRGLRAGERTG